MEKKLMYNMVLARHYENDIARVFVLPDDEVVEPLERLLCNTAKSNDQVVTAVTHSFVITDAKLDEFLKLNGTNRAKVKPITGRIDHAYFGNVKATKEPEEEPKKKPDRCMCEEKPEEEVGVSMADMFDLLDLGVEVMGETIKRLKALAPDGENAEFINKLKEVSTYLFDTNMKGFVILLERDLQNDIETLEEAMEKSE